MEQWADKVAVVTGASAGIGAATCVRLADEGLRVVGFARRTALIDELQAQVSGSGSITSRQCDVTNPDDITEAFQWVEEQFGGVDVLVNNAGVFLPGHITDVQGQQISDEKVNLTMDTNARAVILCARHAIRSMNARGVPGHIVNINSVAGHYVVLNENFNVYGSSKYAVTAFSGSLRAELAQYRREIRVTCISPGLVDTDMTAAAREQQLPMLRPANVADAVAYALGTPPSVNINEIIIRPMHEKWL